jgi:hypothetical protein
MRVLCCCLRRWVTATVVTVMVMPVRPLAVPICRSTLDGVLTQRGKIGKLTWMVWRHILFVLG